RHLFNQLARKQKCTSLLLRKHNRRQMISVDNKISFTCFGSDGHTGFHQSFYVTVYCAQADLKSFRDFFSFHDALRLDLNENSGESVYAIHTAKYGFNDKG